HFAAAERAALAGISAPAEIKAHELPHGIEPEAARHHRIALEVAFEKPQVRMDVEFSEYAALAFAAAGGADVDDAVDHQHLVDRQTRVAGTEHLAVSAAEQLVAVVAVLGNE